MAIPVWTFMVKSGPNGQVWALRQSHGGSLYGYPGLDLYGQVWTFVVKFGPLRSSLGVHAIVLDHSVKFGHFDMVFGPFGQVRDTKVSALSERRFGK